MEKFKGIILAGGTGSRLLPLTKVTNKHLLPVYNKPMIFYPIEFLRDSGVTDILIILGGNSVGDFINLLGNGGQLGVNITYKFQYKPDGIAGALKLARDFVGESPFIVHLGDNWFEKSWFKLGANKHSEGYIKFKVEDDESGEIFSKDLSKPYASIFIAKTNSPSSFGVPTFDEYFNVVKITEKPSTPDSDFAVTGLYRYDRFIWELLDKLEPSKRGELEITDVNNWYITNGWLEAIPVPCNWSDCGDIESLHITSQLVREKELARS